MFGLKMEAKKTNRIRIQTGKGAGKLWARQRFLTTARLFARNAAWKKPTQVTPCKLTAQSFEI